MFVPEPRFDLGRPRGPRSQPTLVGWVQSASEVLRDALVEPPDDRHRPPAAGGEQQRGGSTEERSASRPILGGQKLTVVLRADPVTDAPFGKLIGNVELWANQVRDLPFVPGATHGRSSSDGGSPARSRRPAAPSRCLEGTFSIRCRSRALCELIRRRTEWRFRITAIQQQDAGVRDRSRILGRWRAWRCAIGPCNHPNGASGRLALARRVGSPYLRRHSVRRWSGWNRRPSVPACWSRCSVSSRSSRHSGTAASGCFPGSGASRSRSDRPVSSPTTRSARAPGSTSTSWSAPTRCSAA